MRDSAPSDERRQELCRKLSDSTEWRLPSRGIEAADLKQLRCSKFSLSASSPNEDLLAEDLCWMDAPMEERLAQLMGGAADTGCISSEALLLFM